MSPQHNIFKPKKNLRKESKWNKNKGVFRSTWNKWNKDKGSIQLNSPLDTKWNYKAVSKCNAGRRTDFRDKKIERFFWRDYSGEKLLPENRFLGQ